MYDLRKELCWKNTKLANSLFKYNWMSSWILPRITYDLITNAVILLKSSHIKMHIRCHMNATKISRFLTILGSTTMCSLGNIHAVCVLVACILSMITVDNWAGSNHSQAIILSAPKIDQFYGSNHVIIALIICVHHGNTPLCYSHHSKFGKIFLCVNICNFDSSAKNYANHYWPRQLWRKHIYLHSHRGIATTVVSFTNMV